MAEISLAKARTMIRKTLEAGRAQEMKPLAVAVLDAGGHVIAFERSDGAPPGRFELARAKAYGAVMLGMGGTAQRDRAEAQAYFMIAANGIYGGQLAPVPGGILVRDKRGRVVGAVGVTGDTSENDLAVGIAGIEAAGFAAEG
ncbi:GlcG/HbpS family heme-binding protein [Sinisalibacter lacisalsi]|uniref:Glcg protein n=1 Tax=Sinisalibacter lacisalsi TaxID=1526570 RepID=A0ABQ1QP56_9RHOB|nr:heme-binding protein [Sinisalibacter lacisalsi]GGD35081.1 hypothetical protein GCM10011358_18890 [Sinisalibacter lacisalsi]